MKKIYWILPVSAIAVSFAIYAEQNYLNRSPNSARTTSVALVSNPVEVKSDRAAAHVNVARVVKVISLVDNFTLKVNASIVDLGGSTDMSPTQIVYLNIYAKGEMFSTDATFKLADVYSVQNARRTGIGRYEVLAEVPNAETGMPEMRTILVDARKAATDIMSVKCEDFDCEASSEFESSITVDVR